MGKRLRFSVFERDGFTCQYCGAQPPDAVLVIDHVTPVVAGGGNGIENLVSACESCNQGKAARVLGNVPPRPDADLLYLRTQQEVGEIRRYQDAIRAREAAMAELVSALQNVWAESSGEDWFPADRIVRQLLSLYSVEVVYEVMGDVGYKVGTGYVSDSRFVPYIFKAARTTAINRGEIESGPEFEGAE